MELLSIKNAERAAWPYSYLGSGWSAVTAGADGAPEAPSGLEGCTTLAKVTQQASVASNWYLRHMHSRQVRLVMWHYVDMTWGTGDSTFIGVLKNQANQAYGWLYIKKTLVDDNKGFHFYCAPMDDAGNYLAWQQWITPNTGKLTAGWYKHVIDYTCESAVGGDGAVTWTVYAEDGVTALGTATRTGIATGKYPLALLQFQMPKSGTMTYSAYIADVTLTDASDDPGILCPFVYQTEDGGIRLKVVCDQPVTEASATYGATGTEHDAEPVALADSDGGRIHEFSLPLAAPGTTFRYQVTLDGTTITSLDGSDDGFEVALPGAEDTTVAIGINDVHDMFSTREPRDKNMYVLDRGIKGRPHVLFGCGDIFGTYAAATGGREVARQWQYWAYTHIRDATARALIVPVLGNHEGDWNADGEEYIAAMLPREAQGWGQTRSVRVGNMQVFAVDDGIMAEEDVADWIAALPAAIEASDARYKVILAHGPGVDHPASNISGSNASYTAGMSDDNALALHTALAELAGEHNLFYIHGHIHGGIWHLKDGVTYIGLPPFHATGAKDTGFGNHTLPAGDPGSRPKTIWAYGSNGCAGWYYAVFNHRWSRHMMWDTNRDAGYKYRVSKALDQIRAAL